MSSDRPAPTLTELLGALPADPAVTWPSVPPAPVTPGPPWQARTTEGTAQLVWAQAVPAGTSAGALWHQHRRRFGETGLWPVLVDDDFWEAVELEPFDSTPPFTDARALLRRLVSASGGEDGDAGAEVEAVPRGPMPDVVVDDRTPEQVIDASDEHSTLVLVPARAGWVVPELLAWDGAVNGEIHGREHSAVLGRWAGLHGAELFGLGRDVVQLLVTRPPTDDRGRLEAATEMYAYCPDVVDQGVETLENLTRMAGGREWWLWWD